MEVSNNLAPTLVQAVLDAIKFNQSLLQSQTLRNVEDYEEYLMTLGTLLGHLEDQYKAVEGDIGIPFETLVPKDK